MPESDLLTIGAFARACGLSASALRFYADAGVLVPAVIDEATGYRYYTPDQTGPAQLIRRLRAADMPLPAVVAVLAEPDPARAAALVDDHLAELDRRLRAVHAAADAARSAVRVGTIPGHGARSPLGPTPTPGSARPSGPGPASGPALSNRRVPASGSAPADDTLPERFGDDIVRIRGPVLAAAIDQIAAATITDPDLPVLNTIHLESTAQELTLTATDRYRLATRTLRPADPSAVDWSATVDADDLRTATSWLRREHTVTIRPDVTHVVIAAADPAGRAGAPEPGASGGDRRPEVPGAADRPGSRADGRRPREYANGGRPGQRGNAADEPGGSSEFGVGGPDRRRCRRSTEQFPDYRAMLAALPAVTTRVVLSRTAVLDALEQSGSPTITLHIDPAGEVRTAIDDNPRPLPATVTGPGMTIHFAVTTLYPAVAAAIGPDVMLDLTAPDLPARIRSADDGDQLTLAMPCRPAADGVPFR
ncbi:DNA polymerase III subunit beta family protein [Nocardia sp. MW-W600-9]